MSILIKDSLSNPGQIFNLNVAVATAVLAALEKHDIPGLSIKWPNDIMAGNKKIGGILIENSIKPDGSVVSIAGIGLNVNQSDFSALPKASSLHVVTNRVFDKEVLCEKIVQNIIDNVHFLGEHSDVLWQVYHSRLFKSGVPMPFEDVSGNRFMGIIQRVDAFGKLELLLEDDKLSKFEIKQIQMLF